jgi:hypothetical protein
MRRINIMAPPALTSQIVQGAVVTRGVDMNLKKCGEVGDGTFSWLLRFDPSALTLTTGGAAPTPDPIGKGYCFVNTTTAAPIPLAPVKVNLTKNNDGTYDSAAGTSLDINIPIYYVTSTATQLIILPISGGAVKGLHFSNNGNCVGSLDTTALNAQCADDANCAKWKTDASIAGYITLEQADKVSVPLLTTADGTPKTLCVLLSGDPGPKCKRDASNAIAYKGDYCSTSKSAGGCADSVWMAATFAASSVNINDGTGTPDCTGGSSIGGNDAGSDTGAGTDSGTESDTGAATDAASE